MRGLYALFFVGLLIVLALVGTQSLGLYYIFGIVIPYVAFFGFMDKTQ
jgi:hypothetical protein